MKQYSNDFLNQAYILHQFLTIADWKGPLLKYAYHQLGGPVMILGENHRIIGEYHEEAVESPLWRKLIDNWEFSDEWIDQFFHESVKTLTEKATTIYYDHHGESGWSSSIFKDGRFLGFLSVCEGKKKLQEEDFHLMRLMCNIIAARMSEQNTNAPGTFAGSLLTDILDGKIESQSALDRSLKLKNRKVRPYYQAVRMTAARSRYVPPSSYVLGRLSGFCTHILSAEYEDGIVVLLEASTRTYLNEVCEMFFSQVRQMGWNICVSEVFFDLLSLPQYFAQTVRLEEQIKSEEAAEILFYSDFKLEDLFARIREKPFYRQYYNDAVVSLAGYDQENGTNLSKTLHQYLRLGQSVSKCSRALDIHKNTVMLHLDKIREITNNDLSDPDELFHMLLTFQMKQHYQE